MIALNLRFSSLALGFPEAAFLNEYQPRVKLEEDLPKLAAFLHPENLFSSWNIIVKGKKTAAMVSRHNLTLICYQLTEQPKRKGWHKMKKI